MSALTINGLRIDVTSNGHDVVDEIDLHIEPGQVLGLVGESGSGKTTVGLAVLGHARKGVRIVAGTVEVGGTQMLSLSPAELRKARGSLVTYVPQDPSTALNPALRIVTQIMEVLEQHNFGDSQKARMDRCREVMADVALPSDDAYLRRYPHELSGGQQQRVGLAMAFACRPAVIVLDEPTTGLDVSTQSHVLATVRELCRTHDVAALYVTHDLAVVANLADRVAVMYAGRIIELGPTANLFARAAHPYARHLISAAPDISGDRAIVGLAGRAPSPGKRPVGCAFAPRCELADDDCRKAFPPIIEVAPTHTVRCIKPQQIPSRLGAPSIASVMSDASTDVALLLSNVDIGYGSKIVVHDISFSVDKGECLALVGESGSGKTTLSRSIGGLHREWTGEITLAGEPLAKSARDRSVKQRLNIQYVFQNPYSSLNPRRSIGESVSRPLLIGGMSKGEAGKVVGEMLERVALTASFAQRYPDQLSGGERQRVAIARALASRPDVLVCDEVTSALDVLVQAAIVELLGELRENLGLAMLFVTHNLPLVRSIAQRTAVMSAGRIIELGPTADILTNPKQEYTQRLLADTPNVGAAIEAIGEGSAAS